MLIMLSCPDKERCKQPKGRLLGVWFKGVVNATENRTTLLNFVKLKRNWMKKDVPSQVVPELSLLSLTFLLKLLPFLLLPSCPSMPSILPSPCPQWHSWTSYFHLLHLLQLINGNGAQQGLELGHGAVDWRRTSGPGWGRSRSPPSVPWYSICYQAINPLRTTVKKREELIKPTRSTIEAYLCSLSRDLKCFVAFILSIFYLIFQNPSKKHNLT